MPNKINGYNATDPRVALTGASGTGAVADKAAEAAGAAAATSDTLTLTGSARTLQKLGTVVAQTPIVNTAKVDSIKQAVNSGTYQIDAARVADKILQFESDLK